MKKFYFLIVLISVFILSALNVFAQNPPVAVPDTAKTRCDIEVKILPRMNDYDPDGDLFYITFILGAHHGQVRNSYNKDTIWYTPDKNFFGTDSTLYRITDVDGQSTYGKVYFKVTDGHCWDSVDVSNINAALNDDGLMFFDYESESHYTVPKGGTQGTFFANLLCVGGFDSNDSLRIVSHSYGTSQSGFYPGPISSVYDSTYKDQFYRTWKVTKAEIEYHKTHWWLWGYTGTEAMQKWPAHGNTSLGQSANLAPFYDFDGDGVYEINHGDYPIIRGDEALLFLFSDGQDTLSYDRGGKLGIDVIGMMYAYDCPADSALWNSIFLNFKVYNRSSNIYHDTYIGFFSDFDIGFSDDDFMGCDVERSTYYGYNGDDIDGVGGANQYGAYPPVQGVAVLKGPLMDPDGSDNPPLIDYGINGYGFGNGINDDECLGLTNTMGFFRSYNQIFDTTGVPNTVTAAQAAYNLLRSYLQDDSPLNYGGTGWVGDSTSYGPACRFLYPADTDTLHWGTGYLEPNGPSYWSEDTVHNYPWERFGYGSSGPFTFAPGEMKEIDLALVFARNFNDPDNRAAIPIMQQRVDSLRKYFKYDYTPCNGSFFGVQQKEADNFVFQIFPNPATNLLNFEITNADKNSVVTILDLYGNKIMSRNLNNKMNGSFDISGLSRGMYLISILNGNKYLSKKFVKL